MADWWYVDKERKIGPISVDEVRRLLQSGRLTPTTLMWSDGAEDWRPLSDIQELSALRTSVPPPVPPIEFDPLTFPLATRWPRFLARIFDVWWETLSIAVLLGYVFGQYSATFIEWINKPGSSQLYGLLCIPLGLVLDALIYRFFGNTPGKALTGLVVTNINGRPLTLSEYLTRNFKLWISGLALGFPLVNLFTMALQSRRVGKGQQATYDEPTGFRVHSRPLGIARRVLFALAFIGLFAAVAVLQSMQQQADRETLLSISDRPFSWENPVTHVSVQIDARWKPSMPESSDGQQVFLFSERADRAAVALALERGAGITIGDYIQAFQKVNATTMRFSDGGRYFQTNGHPSWEVTGTMVDTTNSRLNVQVTQFGSAYWRVVTIQVTPYSYSDQHVAALRTTLWHSVQQALQ